MSKIIVCDLEANGLLDTVTKVHCLVAQELGTDKYYEVTGTNQEIGTRFLRAVKAGYTYVFHNGYGYDFPVLGTLCGVSSSFYPDRIAGTDVQIIDTLALSRELWPERPGGHSLAAWQERVTGKKPIVEDWENQPLEVYLNRCREDVNLTGNVLIQLMKEAEIEY